MCRVPFSSQYFCSRTGYIRTLPNDQPDNRQLFYTIEILDEAIRKKKQVSFRYLEYGTDKRLHPRRNREGQVADMEQNQTDLLKKMEKIQEKMLEETERLLKEKEKDKKDHRQKTGDEFNIFTVLDRERKEESTHCRLIYELLNPKGSHGCGDVSQTKGLKLICC